MLMFPIWNIRYDQIDNKKGFRLELVTFKKFYIINIIKISYRSGEIDS